MDNERRHSRSKSRNQLAREPIKFTIASTTENNDLQTFNLTTWAGDRMVAYEPISARTNGEIVAFVHGVLTERTRGHTNFLARMGVRYIIDHGHRPLEALTIGTETIVGTWHLVEDGRETKLLWQPSGEGN